MRTAAYKHIIQLAKNINNTAKAHDACAAMKNLELYALLFGWLAIFYSAGCIRSNPQGA